MLTVTFWSPIEGKGRWVAGATPRKSSSEHAADQVRDLRAQGVAAYAHPVGHAPAAHYGTPPAWMFDPRGRITHEAS